MKTFLGGITRVNDGSKSSRDGADCRDEKQGRDGEVNVPPEREFDEKSAGVQIDADLGEDVEQEREQGQVDADPLAAKPLAEKLGESRGAGSDEHGQEQPS